MSSNNAMSVGESEVHHGAENRRANDRLLSPLLRRVLIVVLSTLLVFQFGELKEAIGEEAVRQAPLDSRLG